MPHLVLIPFEQTMLTPVIEKHLLTAVKNRFILISTTEV